MALVSVSMATVSEASHAHPRIRIDVRKCAHATLREKFAQHIQHPAIPWGVGIGQRQRAEILTQYSFFELIHVCLNNGI